MTLIDFYPIVPEIFVLVMASLILILAAADKCPSHGYVPAMLTLAGAAVLTVLFAGLGTDALVRGLFIADPMGDVLKLATYVAAMACFAYSRAYLREHGMLRGEYFALALFAVLGMMVMISAASLLTLYLGLELLSLSLYTLVALQRDSARASEAAMKYFILGALASGLLLYGMSLLYGATGSLELAAIAQALHGQSGNTMLLTFALVFIVAGIGFKLGVAPFHMWVPDVYQGAPTAVTLFIASAPKLAAFAIVMRMLVLGLPSLMADWQMMLAVMAVASLAIGNLAAIMQTNIKRMLAYSTISHMGFLLLGVLAASIAGFAAGMFYVISYVIMTLAGFGLILHLSSKDNEADTLDAFRGLNTTHPWLAALMAIVMLSMAGLPPFLGFYAKFFVLQALVGGGWITLAVVAVLFSLIGAYYYLRVIKLMYFDAPVEGVPQIAPSGDAAGLLSANGLAVLGLGILPQGLLTVCVVAVQASL
ncbi:MAG: NADH-quinone oxidoreductase subunit NuoN [Betaproteobacteria bacterium]|nr:MAG: NADH-quinone oxidoreductase subunit NuoN [Betaproteobacteria bacterium]